MTTRKTRLLIIVGFLLILAAIFCVMGDDPKPSARPDNGTLGTPSYNLRYGCPPDGRTVWSDGKTYVCVDRNGNGVDKVMPTTPNGKAIISTPSTSTCWGEPNDSQPNGIEVICSDG